MFRATQMVIRAQGLLYGVTAIASMTMGYADLEDIYRDAARTSHMLKVAGAHHYNFAWTYFAGWGIVLLVPPSLLIFSAIGIWETSGRRIRAFLSAIVVSLPFVLVTFVWHSNGVRTALYVAGPMASLMVFLASRRISLEKTAFWSSAVLVATRAHMIFWHLGYLNPSTLGSYVRWAECEAICSALAIASILGATIRLAYVWRGARAGRGTFAA